MIVIPDSVEADLLSWQEHAACQNVEGLEVMYPDGTNAKAVEKAKGYCEVCPVLEECRDWALTARELYGVWGGMTEGERWAQWREKRMPRTKGGGRLRAPCGTRAARARHQKYRERCDTCKAAAAAGFPADRDEL